MVLRNVDLVPKTTQFATQKSVLSSILFSFTSYLGVWEMRRRCYIDIIDECRTLSRPPQVTRQQTITEDGRLPTSSSPSKWYTARRELSADVIPVRTTYY